MNLQSNYFHFLKILQCLLLTEMVFSSCPITGDPELKWVVKGSELSGMPSLLVGEWWNFDCMMNDNTVNATLRQREIWGKHVNVTRVVSKHLEMREKNVFLLPKLNHTDQGRYFCEACGKVKYAGGIYVNSGVAFASPIIIKKPNVEKSKYGSKVTLSCEVKGSYGNYEMNWFKVSSGKKKLLSSKDMSIWSRDNAIQKKVLKIPKMTKKDAARYMCQLRRRIVDFMVNITVDVSMEEISGPLISNFSDRPTLYELEDENIVTINYTVNGIPPLNITWFKLENNKKEKIARCSLTSNTCNTKLRRVEITKRSFTIRYFSFSKDNNVSYLCQAENPGGTTSQKFTVFIKQKPSLVKTKCTNLIYFNKDMQLNCTSPKDKSGETEFSWYFCYPEQSTSCKEEKDWQSVSSTNKFLEVKTVKWKSFLSIRKDYSRIGMDVQGHYRCSAKNKIGKDSLTWVVLYHADWQSAIVSRLKHDQIDDRTSKKFDKTASWRFATIGIGTLLLVTLFFHHRERKRHKKHIMEFQALKFGVTNV